MGAELKAGIIGAGIMGSAVGRVLLRDARVPSIAVAEQNPDRLASAQREFNAQGFADYREMLDRQRPDIVFVATPDWAHFEPVMACLDLGIHVYVEKPLTTTEREAAAIVRRVAETGLKLQVSYNHRWLAPYHAAHRQIRDGAIGRPLVGYARKNNPITVPTRMLASWAKDSSPMWFQSSHDIDLMVWWFDDAPKDVVCTGVKQVLKAQYGWDTWDALQGQLRFRNGGVATFEAAWIYPECHPSMPDSFMSIVGEHGHLQIDRKDEAVEMSGVEGFRWPRSLLNFQVYDQWVGAFPSCISSFVDAVLDNRAPYVTAMDGWIATAVLEAMHESANTGERVAVAKAPDV
ncbi:MAG: Gfo/Idh/MocA family oxidoreductase [Candidatus Hydrogenedentales bacterium]|jgi:predicted dehydrogenase